jgi:glutamate/tyrosine decarboxylase-like PLP-dependent enzyme
VTQSLDLTPDEFRRLSALLGDMLASYLAELPERRVYPGRHPEELRKAFDEPLPEHGFGLQRLLDTLRDRVLPDSMGIGSPRYFGQFNPSPIPLAAQLEVVASVLNQNTGSFLQSPVMTAIEDRTVLWFCELAGLGPEAYGQFTSGGTAATLSALKIARDRLGQSVRQRGVLSILGRARVYASDQCHFSIARSLDVLGLGREALVEIDSDANYRMCADVLAERIAQDRAAGMMPMAIVATAGTTPTGSCDPLPAIADIAAKQRVHLHVDAAYGGAALLSRALAPRLRGIERADSITIDPHKWMLMPNEIGSLLVKNGDWLKEAFGETPSYLADSADRHQMLPDYYRLSLQGSRRARAFRVWGVLQVLGREAIASALEQHVELISVLRDRVAAMPDFELCHDPDFALQCFRFAPAGTSPEEQDDLNRAIQRHVEASGEAWFATTVLRGRKVLRINIESFRTTEQDVHRTIDAIADAARAVLPRG